MVERQFSATGEMGRRIVAFDWASTPLGDIHDWPSSLKTAVRLILGARYPMFVWWGDELINLYNDAYIPVLGGRHPEALGRPAEQVWHEIWPDVGPEAERVLKDQESTWQEEALLLMQRNNYVEETYFTYSYSPLSDDDGMVRGVFCACTEDTDRVLGERRLGVLRRVSEVGGEASTVPEACAGIEVALREADCDVSFALLYLVDPGGATASLAANAGVPTSSDAAPARIDLSGAETSPWPVVPALAGERVRVDGLDPALGLPGGAWPEPAATAFVLPLGRSFHDGPVGFLVAGASPRRSIDRTYERFFDLLASGVAGALGNARALEEDSRRVDMLTELDRSKTTFFSNVSHEFRTPLTLMLAPLDSALQSDGRLGPEDVTLVRRNGRRLLKLVNTMLDFARVEAGRADAFFEPIDLARETADLASAFRSAFESAGLELTVDCPALEQPVYLDGDMWEKIVLNLMSNALKHTFEGGVEITVRPEDNFAVLTVRDSGTGIPPAEVPRIFDRFHRVRGIRSRTREGTGIGLALVQELVHVHGGAIEVESEVPGGSTFTVRIPFGSEHLPADLVAAEGDERLRLRRGIEPYIEEASLWMSDPRLSDFEAGGIAPSAGEHKAAAPLAIIADDNPDMRGYLTRLLEGAGYRVQAAADGERAFDLVKQTSPDVLISDVMMPESDGLEFVRRVRADVDTRRVPIVLISARATEEARFEGLRAGADHYVVKPFSARELIVRLNGAVALSRFRSESARRERELKSRAQTAVRQSEERFRRMADNAPVMVWVTNAQGEATFLSRSWYEFTGQASGEALGYGWVDAIHPDDRDEARATFLEANADRQPLRMEYRLRRQDGSYRWVLDAATPHVDEAGIFHGYIGSVADVTDRREAEAALRVSEGQFRALANSIPQLAWMAEPDGSIFWYNQRWHDYTGRAPDEMIGWGWRSVHDPNEVDRVETKFRAAVAAGTPWEDTFPLRRHDGEMRWHLSRAMPLRNETDEIVLWFGTNTDISGQREMEERLREADRRKDEFLATLAHELRNPLAPLAHGLEMLRHGASHETVGRIQDTMARQLHNMVRLVDDLLDVSRVSRGKIELQKTTLPLSEVLEAAIETVRPALTDAGHHLTLELPDERVEVEGDPTRLEQIFGNLLENAIKYTERGGEIRLIVEVSGQNVQATVADDGIGMAPATLARVFDMFAQDDRAIDRAQGGLGIGLTIVRQLVMLHGGTVEALSAGLGKGSRFTVTLPIFHGAEIAAARQTSSTEAGDEAGTASGGRAAHDAPAASGKKVLIVDDNADAAEMLATLVGVFGHEVTTANDGYQALEVGEKVRPDVIFLDIGMPRLSGYDTCRLIRARPWGADAKIVAVTGWGQEEDRARSRDAGFDVHLVKPVRPRLIKELLKVPGGH